MKLKLLDCTIREGGYLNNWDFSQDCVKSLYNAAKANNVAYFEVGYKNIDVSNSFGTFYKCSDEFLLNLFGYDEDCKLTVLVDVDKYSSDNFLPCNSDYTNIKTVRVATYEKDIDLALKACFELKGKGYETFLNLMAFQRLSNDLFLKLKSIDDKSFIDFVTIADSFGSMYPADVEIAVQKMVDIGFGNLCFHSHNNLKMSFQNIVTAIESGVTVIDASLSGMGRSAGNCTIEKLLLNLTPLSDKENIDLYLECSRNDFKKLIEQFKSSLDNKSVISGLYDIHPKYVNDIFASTNDINKASEMAYKILKNGPVQYNKDFIGNII